MALLMKVIDVDAGKDELFRSKLAAAGLMIMKTLYSFQVHDVCDNQEEVAQIIFLAMSCTMEEQPSYKLQKMPHRHCHSGDAIRDL